MPLHSRNESLRWRHDIELSRPLVSVALFRIMFPLYCEVDYREVTDFIQPKITRHCIQTGRSTSNAPISYPTLGLEASSFRHVAARISLLVSNSVLALQWYACLWRISTYIAFRGPAAAISNVFIMRSRVSFLPAFLCCRLERTTVWEPVPLVTGLETALHCF